MEIKKQDGKVTYFGVDGEPCQLRIEFGVLCFENADEEITHFFHDQIKSLLPYLQSFAQSGTLEPATPLQGEEETNLIKFRDSENSPCELWVELGALCFEYRNEKAGQFSRDQIKILLPCLQSYVSNGTLELATESTLQGEKERIDAIANASAKRVLDILEAQNNEISTLQGADVAMAQNIVDQGKRIEALQNLVKGWRGLTEDVLPDFTLTELQEQTAQLLGEDQGDDLLNRIGKEISDQWKGSAVEKLKELLDRGEEQSK